jgi:DDE_Tnp_1-associated
MEDLSAFSGKPLLLQQSWKVAYPLREALFLVVCATIANCDDYDEIVDWGTANLAFLRGFRSSTTVFPASTELRSVMNRVDPDPFRACFSSWVAACWPDKLSLVAIDRKTSRCSHNRKMSKKIQSSSEV